MISQPVILGTFIMCGRARLASDYSEIRIQLHLDADDQIAAPNLRPTWNLAPMQTSLIVHRDDAGRRAPMLARWSLLPFWSKEEKLPYATFNAKAEGIEAKPAFREPFRKRRCLVPVDGFYEWRKLDSAGKAKQPYNVSRADGRIMTLAGLWDSWKSPAGETIRSFTVITTTPNAVMAPIHNRMPVILAPADWPRWLGETPATLDELKGLLAPCPDDTLTLWPVGRAVGNVRNDGPELAARSPG
jgi:putative SOS response-associated peptidase YedK